MVVNAYKKIKRIGQLPIDLCSMLEKIKANMADERGVKTSTPYMKRGIEGKVEEKKETSVLEQKDNKMKSTEGKNEKGHHQP